MSQSELVEWRAFVKKNKAMKRIKESKLRWAAPVFFIKKKDGSFRLVQDYREVNKWTERDVYPVTLFTLSSSPNPFLLRVLPFLHYMLPFLARIPISLVLLHMTDDR
jgi:hypothetical protein